MKRISRQKSDKKIKIYLYKLLGPFLCYYERPIDLICKGYIKLDKKTLISKGCYKGNIENVFYIDI